MAHLRLVFMGTPEFAVPALSALFDAGHEVACVYSQPPRAAGRGRHARPSPVQAFAEARGIAVRSPVSLKTAEAAAAFAALEADAAVVAAYGLILPRPILSAPRLGCVNIHPSLLPRWRGAAPIQRAILAGDTETGVTIMLLEEGLDCGPILLAARVAIGPDTTGGALHDQLAKLGGGLVVAALAGLDAGTLTPRPQPEEGVTYAPKLTPGEERLDWRAPAVALARKVRAFNPWPGTWFPYQGARIRVIEAEAVAEVAAEAGAEVKAAPGTVLDRRLTVACGEGALRLVRLQRAGRRALDAEAFLRGRHIPAGTVLELPA